jgi:predicted RNase H-like HicB family nuclease
MSYKNGLIKKCQIKKTIMKTSGVKVVIIEPAKEGCAIYLQENPSINSWGSSIDEAKTNFNIAIEEYIEASKDDGYEVLPSELLTGYQLDYKFDLGTLFDYFSIINVSELAQKLNMNSSLLRKYKKGLALASENQRKKIEKGLHQIGEDLLAVRL